jgi:hypothetical protein
MRPSPSLRPFAAFAVIALLALVLSPAFSRAQNSAALINEALDKQVELDVHENLPGALRVIESKTGVPFKVDPAVYELLPWGENTDINIVKIKNQTLRQALTAITRKLGLTFSLGDEAVLVEPLSALRRCPRRATVQELRALDYLAGTPMPVAADTKVKTILDVIDGQFMKSNAAFAVEKHLQGDPRNPIEMVIDLPRNGTMLDALEAIAKQTPATWYPWDRNVVVVPKETHVRDLLSMRKVTIPYAGADVAQVLEDLRRRSGVEFTIEPGALQKVPPEFRRLSVIWDNVSIAQALESIKGVTGLNYAVTESGITITHPGAAQPAGGGGGAAADPVVAQLTLDNGMVVFIRDSQVPTDLKPYLRHRAQKGLDELRQMARQEKFPLAPATQPATPPSTSQPAPKPEKPKDL